MVRGRRKRTLLIENREDPHQFIFRAVHSEYSNGNLVECRHTQIYLVALRAIMNSWKSIVPFLSSSNILKRASARKAASSPRTL